MAWARTEAIVAEVSRYGTIGVSIIGPDGDTWAYHGNRKFVAASTVKIPIMVEVFRRIDTGRLSLEERYTLVDDDRTPGSGVLNHMRAGVELSLYDLIYLMISISDNVATNILIRMVGMDAVNRTMAELGMASSNLSREMRGRPADPEEDENFATPNDYARAIAAILDGEAASKASCEAMASMLTKQQNRRRLARFIPASNTIRWGSKTGTSAGVANDVGFMIAPNGRLIIAVYTENYADIPTAERVIGEVARAAMVDSAVVGPVYTS